MNEEEAVPVMVLLVAPDGSSFRWYTQQPIPIPMLAAAAMQLQAIVAQQLLPKAPQVQAPDAATLAMFKLRNGGI